MKFIHKTLCTVLFTTATLIALSASAAGDIKVRTLDGQKAMLAEYFEPGKWTLVMIWTTYCGVCAQQYPIISALHNERHEEDLKVVGISVDGYRYTEEVRVYIANRPPSFDSVIGEIAEIAPGFNETTGEEFKGTPTYLLFDPQGQIAAQTVGPIKTEAIDRFIRDNPS